MFHNIDAVIFDLDGSLVDSMWIWKQIDIEYLNRFHIPLPMDLSEKIEGMSFSETALYFKENFSITDSVDKIKSDWNEMAWEKYSKEVPLKKGVNKFLAYCRKKGIKLGIATSNSRELAENVIAVHSLQHYFTCIMTGCDVAKGKPAPDIYLKTAEKLHVSPKNCLVFEDVIAGILAGRQAGMQVCAVEDEYSAHQRIRKKELADYYIEDFNDFAAYYEEVI